MAVTEILAGVQEYFTDKVLHVDGVDTGAS